MSGALQFHPLFQWKLSQILTDLKARGWEPVVASGMRTADEQALKVRLGYSRTMNSWHVRSTQGLPGHGRDAVDVVEGNAADIVDRRYGWNGPAAKAGFQFWKDPGEIARKHGCRWGGDWKSFPDVAHVEFLFIEAAPLTDVAV